MKSSFLKIGLRLLIFQLGLFLCQSILAQVNFTVTPSAVSNTYSGVITLQVTGLTNTETVVVQKFIDANGNGVVDAPDDLVQQFDLTDGSPGMVFGGVTNINVPGDTDGSVNSQITAQLHPNFNFVQVFVGKYLFVLSSPVGHFSPQTKPFSVTNFPYAQTISGNVVNSGTNVPDAAIILFPAPRGGDNGPGEPVGGTVANNLGAYTIQVPPGTYVPMAFKSNYVANFGTSPVLTLSANQSVVMNLTLTNETSSISGQVVDADNTNLGLPGLTVPMISDSGLIAVGFTDTNGYFNVPVTSGSWGIDGTAAGSFDVLGYVGYNNSYDVNAGDAGIMLPVHKATALFYGSVKDNLGNPLPGIDINASDNDNNNGNSTYSADGYSDVSGNYVVGVLGGLGSDDPWQVQVSGDSSPTDYIFSQTSSSYSGGVTVNAGQAVQQNITAILATNHISGHVQFNGTNVVGVQVVADATIGTNNYQAQVDTDDNGNYSLNVGNGNWNVSVLQCCDDDSLDNILGSGNYQPPASQNVTINNNNGTADFTIQPPGFPLQITTTSLLNGNVGAPYLANLVATGGQQPYNWSLATGSANLPPGLSLTQNSRGGYISGTPTTNGMFNFIVQVTDANFISQTQSLGLIINPTPRFDLPSKISSTQFQFRLNAAFNQNYTIQVSTNLSATNWATLIVTNSSETSSFLILDPNATNKQRFYRALFGP